MSSSVRAGAGVLRLNLEQAPPGYEEADFDGLVPQGVYTVAESRSYAVWALVRGFLKDGKPDYSSQLFRNHIKIYPLAAAANPPKMEFIAGTGKAFNTVHAANYHFFAELHTVIDREPLEFLDPELRGGQRADLPGQRHSDHSGRRRTAQHRQRSGGGRIKLVSGFFGGGYSPWPDDHAAG